MIRFQSHLLSASMCSSMTACGPGCFLSGGSFSSSAKAIDDPMGSATRATADPAQIAAPFPRNGGVVVKGREEAGKLFANFVKPADQGGLCGIKFTPEQTFIVGETLNIQWKAEAEFLTEPYKGSDAFNGADLKMKK